MASALPAEESNESAGRRPRARRVLSVLLLLAINLFNYVDRQVLSAVES